MSNILDKFVQLLILTLGAYLVKIPGKLMYECKAKQRMKLKKNIFGYEWSEHSKVKNRTLLILKPSDY